MHHRNPHNEQYNRVFDADDFNFCRYLKIFFLTGDGGPKSPMK